MDLLASVIAEGCSSSRNHPEGERVQERQEKQEKAAWKNKYDKKIFWAKRLNDACVRDKNLEQARISGGGGGNGDIIRNVFSLLREERETRKK